MLTSAVADIQISDNSVPLPTVQLNYIWMLFSAVGVNFLLVYEVISLKLTIYNKKMIVFVNRNQS